MSSSLDITYINENGKIYSEEYFNSEKNDDIDSVIGCKIVTKTGNRKTEGVCNFTEVPKFILNIINESNRLLINRQDSLLKEIKEEFQLKLGEKDAIISNLRKEVRSKAN